MLVEAGGLAALISTSFSCCFDGPGDVLVRVVGDPGAALVEVGC